MEVTYDSYLKHYGVKGMKWGVRKSDRTQNVDGGRVRTSKKGKVKGVELSKQSERSARTPSADKTRASVIEKKIKTGSVDSVSNKELQDLIKRKNLEEQYSSLTTKEKNKGLVGFGRSFVKDLAKEESKKFVKNMVTAAAKDEEVVKAKEKLKNYARSSAKGAFNNMRR